MITLRDYQLDLVDSVRNAYRAGKRAPLVVSPTGSGKTVLFAFIAQGTSAKGNGVVILVHRQELVDQTCRTLRAFGVDHGVIAAGRTPDRSLPVQVASVQTYVRRLDSFRPALIIADECFPPGTLVDGRRIEEIQPGEFVASFNHDAGKVQSRRVEGLLTREYSGPWYRLTDSRGSSIVCTENHPIFLRGRGYVAAKSLTSHDLGAGLLVYDLPALRRDQGARQEAQEAHLQVLLDQVPSSVLSEGSGEPTAAGNGLPRLREAFGVQGSTACIGAEAQGASVLLEGMLGHPQSEGFFGNSPRHKPKNESGHFDAHDAQQPDAESREPGKDALENGRADVPCSWRERAANQATARAPQCDGVPDGACDPNSGREVSEPAPFIQGRPCSAGRDACDRSGWEIPPAQEVEVSRPKEDGDPFVARLASIEVYERGSGPRPEWVPAKDTVHNLHVDGNHNYFAGGILVHNCHHATAGSWRKIINHHPQARVLGVTATPERLDGRGLKEVFDDLIRGPEVADLIAGGHLAPPVYFAPPQAVDLSHIKTRGGDYAQEDIAEAMDRPAITGDAVAHYSRICRGAPAVAFCSSVAHAQHVADQFNAAGFRSATIDGTMDREARRDVVRALGDGRLHVLTSCEIINEGFDLPLVTAAILLRPTMSLGLHLQQVGRVLRPAPGKTRAVILDHVGNLARHGFAEDIRDWSLDGRPKKKKKAADEDDVKVKQCPECFACHPPAPKCAECGHVYEIKTREIEHVDGELVEIDPKEIARQRKKEQGSAQTLDDLIALGRSRGYKNPAAWAKYVIASRQGRSDASSLFAAP